jgi:hypothetical protein
MKESIIIGLFFLILFTQALFSQWISSYKISVKEKRIGMVVQFGIVLLIQFGLPELIYFNEPKRADYSYTDDIDLIVLQAILYVINILFWMFFLLIRKKNMRKNDVT